MSFLSVVAAMLVLSRTFAHTPGWQALRALSLILGLVALVMLFLPSVGLTQRLMVGVVSVWIVLVAVRVLATSRQPAQDRRRPTPVGEAL